MALVPVSSVSSMALVVVRKATRLILESPHLIKLASLTSVAFGFVTLNKSVNDLISAGAQALGARVSRVVNGLQPLPPSIILLVLGKWLISGNKELNGFPRLLLNCSGAALVLTQVVQLVFLSNALTHRLFNESYPPAPTPPQPSSNNRNSITNRMRSWLFLK